MTVSGYVSKIFLPLVIGFCLDLLAGDPHWLYHPVRLIGRLIEVLEKYLRPAFPSAKRGERTAGVILALAVMAATTAVTAGICIHDRSHTHSDTGHGRNLHFRRQGPSLFWDRDPHPALLLALCRALPQR